MFVVKCLINPLWSSDTIWRHKSGSTLVQAMACCLMAPSHYLNQCWLIISAVRGHSGVSQEITQPSVTKVSLIITYPKYSRGQWVNEAGLWYVSLGFSQIYWPRSIPREAIRTIFVWWIRTSAAPLTNTVCQRWIGKCSFLLGIFTYLCSYFKGGLGIPPLTLEQE